MINIITNPLSESEMLNILRQSPVAPLLPPIGDQQWARFNDNAVTRRWLDAIRERALQEKDEPMPVLTDELYADYYETGTRMHFEKLYFERRKRMGRAVISVACDGVDSPLLASAISKIKDIFNEVSWSLPAHVWNEPTGKNPRTIDLFCAETANMMAQCIDILGPVLDDKFISEIKARLHRDIFENFIANRDNIHWASASHNWNAVCHQGINGAALAAETDLTIVAKMLCETAKGLVPFLSGYTADGGCSEGPGYWNYGFGWFIFLNQQLEKRTSGKLSLIEGDDHVKAIARYGVEVNFSNGYVVNFSDCGPRSFFGGADLLAYLGNRLNDEKCADMAIFKYKLMDKEGINVDDMRSDLFYFTRLLPNCPADLSKDVSLEIGDTYLKDLKVMIARNKDKDGNLWEFAGKGGSNHEHHNHNDCGNYMLNLNGKRAVIEIGAPVYNKAFFSDKRYEFLAARSKGHSLPIINGCEQQAGGTSESTILRNEYNDVEMLMDIDITNCYPPEAECAEYIRSYRFDRVNGSLRVTDKFKLNKIEDLETAIITLSDDNAEKADFTIIPDENTIAAPDEIHASNDHSANPFTIKRIVLKPRQLAKEISIGYEIRVKGKN